MSTTLLSIGEIESLVRRLLESDPATGLTIDQVWERLRAAGQAVMRDDVREALWNLYYQGAVRPVSSTSAVPHEQHWQLAERQESHLKGRQAIWNTIATAIKD